MTYEARDELEWKTRRSRIDPRLKSSGWEIARGDQGKPLPQGPTALTEVPTGNGPADYALATHGQLRGVAEAKRVGEETQEVLKQAERYARGLPDTGFNVDGYGVPFLYSSNGEIIWFRDVRHELNMARKIARFHTPGAIEEMLSRDMQNGLTALAGLPTGTDALRPYQWEAVEAVEAAIAARKRQMLVAMATGTGKTRLMVNQIYRLMKSGVVKRVLFLVDRRALAAQAVREFGSFEAEPGLKFNKTYEVYSQRFQSGDLDVAPLGALAKIVGGGTPKTSELTNFANESGIPWVTPADLGKHKEKLISRGARFLSDQGLRTSSAQLLPARTVILSSRAPIGYLAVAANAVATNQGCKSFICRDELDPDYLYHYLRYARPLIADLSSGTTFAEISAGNAAKIPVVYPPLEEQRRIAAKLDDLLGRVAATRERLDRVPAILRHFRQSVLAAAVSGRLTEDDQSGSGSKVLPAGWRRVELHEVCESISDGDHQAPPKADEGIPFVVISNMNTGTLDVGGASRFVPEAYYASLKAERQPRRGDILYSVTGSFGITARVETDERFCFQRHIALIRPSRHIDPDYLLLALRSEVVGEQARDVATGTAQMTVPLSGLRNFEFPAPPPEKQRAVVESALALLDLCTRIEARSRNALRMTGRVSDSVLARAFRGEFVPGQS